MSEQQQSRYRPVPRNIDRPNRSVEYLLSFLTGYYAPMFLFHDPKYALLIAFTLVYLVYKVTMNKPEGQAFRLVYKYFRIGKMVPGARHVKRFEI